MSKRIRNDISLRLPLYAIVTNSASRAECLLDVTRLKVAFLLRIMRPHPGQEIGLELKANRELVGLLFTDLFSRRVNPVHGAELTLNMVTNFVRNNVGLSEGKKVPRQPQQFRKLSAPDQ